MLSQNKWLGSIRARLLGGTMALALLPLVMIAVLIALLSARLASDALTDRLFAQLSSIGEVKALEISEYIGSLASATRSLGRSGDLPQLARELSVSSRELPALLNEPREELAGSISSYYTDDYQREFGIKNSGDQSDMAQQITSYSDLTLAMQYLFISENPQPLGRKHLMRRPAANTGRYGEIHADLQDRIEQWMLEYGFYDIFLVDLDGVIVYSYFKEIDFGTSLLSGPFAETGIGEAFREAVRAADPQGVYMTDFSPYPPSYMDQAAFLSMPLFSDGQRTGVLITQIPIDRINATVNFSGDWREIGLGETGEALLLGRDGRHRAASRFALEDAQAYSRRLTDAGTDESIARQVASRETSIGLVADDSLAAHRVLRGESSSGIFEDYLGRSSLVSFLPIETLNQRFGYMIKQNADEAFIPISDLRRQSFVSTMLGVIALGLVALFVSLRLSASINRPITRFASTVDRVGQGEVDLRVGLEPRDEIGTLAVAFDNMMDERVSVQRRIEDENFQLNESIINILQSVAELSQKNFTIVVPVSEDVTGAVSDALNLTTREVSMTLSKVSGIADLVSSSSEGIETRTKSVLKQAQSASDEAVKASEGLQQTAVALREMSVEARGADEQATNALETTESAIRVVQEAVKGILETRDQIRETEKRVKRLAERSQEIGSVVNIVGQIAERTSVLALNASMQAVTAGEAGRGFAVVADEVKRLAESARDATQQISGMVGAIQADTGDALQTMNRTITEVVEVSRKAEQSGEQMGKTRSATLGLVTAVRSIADSTTNQEGNSARLLDRAYSLLQSSQKTLEDLEAQQEDVAVLLSSSQTLVETVQQFKLPSSGN